LFFKSSVVNPDSELHALADPDPAKNHSGDGFGSES
jgi:hypothetical protein